jgi:phosphotriesterase-related protein
VTIHTVSGPVDLDALKWVSMHEHIFCDARTWFEKSATPPPAGPQLVPENLGWLRWNLHGLEDNLLLDDADAAIEDLKTFRVAGGTAILELSNVGLGRRVAELREVSRRAGVAIMVGTGLYIAASHPDWASDASTDDLTSWMLEELSDGIEGTGIRPAVIGEIGTSSPIHPHERKVLVAAARAAAQTGAAINVHLDPRGAHALDILELLIGEGAVADRIIFSHMDERLDLTYHKAVLEAGAIVEYDTFGSEFYWPDLHRDPTDLERLEALVTLLEDGYSKQCVIGCDIWMKALLTRYGGPGYGHLPLRILPALGDKFEVPADTLADLIRHNPRRLLDR